MAATQLPACVFVRECLLEVMNSAMTRIAAEVSNDEIAAMSMACETFGPIASVARAP